MFTPMIQRNDRVFICGRTGSGKSFLARRLFEAVLPPRIVIDPKADTEATGGMFRDGRQAVTFTDPARIPTGEVLRFVPRDPGDLEAYDRLYAGLFEIPHMFVWCDEVADVAPSTRITPAVRRFVKQGRVRGLGHLALNQEPTWVDRTMIANAEHVMVFATQVPDHVRTLAEVMGLDRASLDGYLRELPRHGFVWYSARNQEVAICDPVRR